MKQHSTEIIIGILGLVTTSAAWIMGGRQKAKNEHTDAITVGTDKIVDTSNKLLERLEKLLNEETQRHLAEKAHRELCETSLREHKEMISELQKKVSQLEKYIK
jgi:uncharacterized protein HemX